MTPHKGVLLHLVSHFPKTGKRRKTPLPCFPRLAFPHPVNGHYKVKRRYKVRKRYKVLKVYIQQSSRKKKKVGLARLPPGLLTTKTSSGKFIRGASASKLPCARWPRYAKLAMWRGRIWWPRLNGSRHGPPRKTRNTLNIRQPGSIRGAGMTS